MNNRSIDVLVIFSAILATLWFFYSDANDSARDSDDGSIALVPLAQHAKTAEATHAGSWLGSPFGNGLPAKERVAAKPQHVLARQKKMESLGYGSPPAYYDMSLNTLKALAKKGDGDAMLQLAEQYSEEANFLASDPDYPKGEDLKMLAKQYLVDAVNAGYSRAAAILSKKHFEENNPVEAYAWKMMSEKLGDGNNSVWGKETNQFASLTEEQKQLANAKFASILEMDLAARARLRTHGQPSR
jgi:hypothetical protein